MDKTVSLEDFGSEFEAIIEAAVNEEKKAVNDAVNDAAKVAKTKLKNAPAGAGKYKDWGEYSSGWRLHKDVNYTGDTTITIAQSRKKAPLTHLLERGHVNANGHGRAKAFPHIEPAAEAAFDELDRRLRK